MGEYEIRLKQGESTITMSTDNRTVARNVAKCCEENKVECETTRTAKKVVKFAGVNNADKPEKPANPKPKNKPKK